MLAFNGPQAAAAPESRVEQHFVPDVDEFVQLLLEHDASVASSYVSAMRTQGTPLPVLYLDLLAPAARRLGVMWEEDECSFTEVTIGVCRMHQVLLEFSRCFDGSHVPASGGKTALILPAPGEQHTFGLFMVMEFLRKAGWNCCSGSPSTRRDFLRLAREEPFDVIGISISSDQFIDVTAELVADMRRDARNADTVFLAGGRAIIDDPDLARKIGVDAMATDGEEAVRQIDRLYRKATGHT
jgi:methanogenic corrinoid protein MtbC1